MNIHVHSRDLVGGLNPEADADWLLRSDWHPRDAVVGPILIVDHPNGPECSVELRSLPDVVRRVVCLDAQLNFDHLALLSG